MYEYLFSFYIALALSFFATPVIREVLVKLNLFDIPDERKIHIKKMPKMGGIAFYIAFFITIAAFWKLNYNDIDLHLYHRQFLGIILCGIILFILGIYDDIVGANANNKFFIHILVGIILMLCNIRVETIAIPFTDGKIILPLAVSALFTALWVTAVINIMNLIDGMDGLASGIAVISCFIFLLIGIIQGNVFVVLICACLGGAILGFLKYNFPPASIFMGDVGSMFIGFILSAVAIITLLNEINYINVIVAFSAIGIPIIDTSWAIIRRARSGAPLFKADRKHIHHVLLDRGYSQKKALVFIYEISCLFGIFSVFLACIYYI